MKTFTIGITKRDRKSFVTGDIPYLLGFFGIDLKEAKSLENNKGNFKINENPRTIKTLIENLSKSEYNIKQGVCMNSYIQVENPTVEEVKEEIISITELEMVALVSITQADFYENGRDSNPWDYSVLECCELKGKVRSGVFSSLTQKGLILVTEKMKKFTQDYNGKRTLNKFWIEGELNFGTISITELGYATLDKLGLIDEDGYFKEFMTAKVEVKSEEPKSKRELGTIKEDGKGGKLIWCHIGKSGNFDWRRYKETV